MTLEVRIQATLPKKMQAIPNFPLYMRQFPLQDEVEESDDLVFERELRLPVPDSRGGRWEPLAAT